ncbi:hypothetical protein V8E54_005215 [Elaphomyces granulatus]
MSPTIFVSLRPFTRSGSTAGRPRAETASKHPCITYLDPNAELSYPLFYIGRTDFQVYKGLYGLHPYIVSLTDNGTIIRILNQHAGDGSVQDTRKSARPTGKFSFWSFLKALDESRNSVLTSLISIWPCKINRWDATLSGDSPIMNETLSTVEEHIRHWDHVETARQLQNLGVEEKHCEIFEQQEITGDILLEMDQGFIFMKEFDDLSWEENKRARNSMLY